MSGMQIAPSAFRVLYYILVASSASVDEFSRMLGEDDDSIREGARIEKARRDGTPIGVNSQRYLDMLTSVPGALVDQLEAVGPTPQVLAAWNGHLAAPVPASRVSQRSRACRAPRRRTTTPPRTRGREHRSHAVSSTRRAAGAGSRSSDDGPEPEPPPLGGLRAPALVGAGA